MSKVGNNNLALFNQTKTILNYYSVNENIKNLFIVFVIFFWPIQIPLYFQGVPFYIFLIVIFLPFVKLNYYKFLIRFVMLIFILYTISIIQLFSGVNFFALKKTLLGLIIFSFLISLFIEIFKKLEKNTILQQKLFKVFKVFLKIQLIIQFFQLILSKAGYYDSGYPYILGFQRVSGLFNEPSHVAFGLAPFLYLWLFHKKFAKENINKSLWFYLLFIFCLAPSTTLLGELIILYILKFFSSKKLKDIIKYIFVTIIFLLFAIFIIFKIEFVRERVFGVLLYFTSFNPSDVNNITALAFIKGYEMAVYSLKHYFLGVGFLNLQFLNKYSKVSYISNFLYDLNSTDGSSQLFKIVGEYGWLGLIFVVYSFLYFIKNCSINNSKYIIKTFFVSGLIASYLRGASYFDGFPILGITLLIGNFFGKEIIFLKIKSNLNVVNDF